MTLCSTAVKKISKQSYPRVINISASVGEKVVVPRPNRLELPLIALNLAAMRTEDFNYHLPPEMIAQKPAEQRDQSRLLVLNRQTEFLAHRQFPDLLEYLVPGDVLVLNDSRVIPARLRGINAKSGGKFELLLLTENKCNDWWAMVRPGKRAQVGTRIEILEPNRQPAGISAIVREVNDEGHRRLEFVGTKNIFDDLDHLGEIPLPPYIERSGTDEADRERYQTVYSQTGGSVAAPTAGLHFTRELLEQIKSRGVEIHYVTLHVGLGTFSPVKAESIADHVMHEERFVVSDATAQAVNRAKAEGRRVVAVGTTTVRVLESVAAKNSGALSETRDRTNIFIYPPRQFRIVDALVTNFHLPSSTLLMLVSAFASPGESHGRELILSAYQKAIEEKYRFFSYGDAMLIC